MTKPQLGHVPCRGSVVAEWIKRRRDEYSRGRNPGWDVLDDLLEDYRLHADTGVPLDQEVEDGRL